MSQTSNNLAFAEASSDAAVAEAIHPRGFPESALHDAPVKSKEQVSIDPGTIMLTKRNGEKELSDPLKLIKWGEFGRDFVKNRNVDFTRIMRDTLQGMRDGMTTTELHLSMIRHTLDGGDDAHNKMAGVLYAPHLHKEIHKDGMPTVYELQKKLRMLGLMRKLDYTKQEYEEIEKIIDHRRDYGYAHFQLEQLVRKYAVQDRVKRIIYETPQYTFMRMAMAVFSKAKKLGRIDHIREFYTLLAENVINAPTPNYVYLGTNLNGLISCCLIHSGDSIGSLNTSDVVAYRMTANGSGIGVFQGQRGIGDPVRNGALEHNGKLPYGNATGKLVRANMQAGRAGAAKIEVNIFDREAVQTAQMQNPRTPAAKRNRDLHAAIQYHGFFLNKAAVDAEIFTFSCKTAPDLFEAFYGKDRELFEKLYAKYENDPTWVKSWVRARDLLVTVGRESYNVGTVYGFIADNVNYNTPFKEPIYCSNLCMEILQPIAPYNDLPDLYENDYIGDIIFLDEEGLPYTKAQRLRFEIKGDPDKREYAFADLEEGMVIRTFGTDEAFITVKEITYRHRQPETSLCALGGIVVYNVRDDAHYDRAMYYTQRMIDYCIDQNDYPFPQIKFTAQNRRNAGIGLLGAATVLARKNLRYNDRAGLEEIHRMAERHMFFAIKNSIDLGEEFGNAGWINKTRWPEGWLPIDTASPYIDEICNPGLQYDWEMLRRRLIKNKGMRFSCLVAHMPTESSSKAAGAPNGWYPVRELSMAKSDSTNVIEWTAPESDLIGQNYQSAWTITPEDMIRVYAVIQKFTDQGISADIFLDRSKDTELSAVALIKRINMMKKYGLKTHYYFNTKTSMDAFGAGAGGGGAKCGSGGCVL